MTPTSPQSTELPIAELRDELSGEVIAPGDPGYEEGRAVFLQGVDRRPAVITRPANADEVSRVVSLARETGLELAVRSGGHSGRGYGTTDGGILLDLRGMREVEIDVDGGAAWAETGMTAGEYTTAVGERGLATGLGDTGAVGIGGITLAGGVGYLVRKNGLTIDDMLGAEVVTADGQLLTVNDESHPDLFWAIRGGGGNFGVVTRLRLRLHEIDGVVGGMMMLPATPETITGLLAAAQAAPEELSTIANVMLAPPMPFIPDEQHGQPIIMVLLAYAGPAEEAEGALAPIRSLATPLTDMVRPMRYPDLYEGPEGPKPTFAASRNLFVKAVDHSAAEAILDGLASATAERAVTQLRVLGGAMARVPADATAFAHRDGPIMVNVAALYGDPEEAAVHRRWVADLSGALDDGTPGAYVGFLSEASEESLRAAYPGATWDRLREVKSKYDPTNLFRLNHNIPADGQG